MPMIAALMMRKIEKKTFRHRRLPLAEVFEKTILVGSGVWV